MHRELELLRAVELRARDVLLERRRYMKDPGMTCIRLGKAFDQLQASLDKVTLHNREGFTDDRA